MDDIDGDINSLDLDDRISSAGDLDMNTQVEDANMGSATPPDEISDTGDLIRAPLPQQGENSILDIDINNLNPFESRLRDLLFGLKSNAWTSHGVLPHAGSPFINIKSMNTIIPLPIPENPTLKHAIFSSLSGGAKTSVISFKSNDIELLDPSLYDNVLESLEKTHLQALGFSSRMQWSLEVDQLWMSSEKAMVTILAGRDPSIIARVVVLLPSCFQGLFRLVCKHEANSKSFKFKPITEGSTKLRILVTYGSTDFYYNPPQEGVVTWLTFNVRFHGPQAQIPREPSVGIVYNRLRKLLTDWPTNQEAVFIPLSPESTPEEIAPHERPLYDTLMAIMREGIITVEDVELQYTFEGQTQNQLQEDDTYYDLLQRKDYEALMRMNRLVGDDALALDFLDTSPVAMTQGSLNSVIPVYHQMSVHRPFEAETEAEYVTLTDPITLRQMFSIFALKISRRYPPAEEAHEVYSSAPKRRKVV